MTASAETIYDAFREGLLDPTPPEPLTPMAAALFREAMNLWRVDPAPAPPADRNSGESIGINGDA